MKRLYFAEYMQSGSGVPVDVTVGLRDKQYAIKHARGIAVKNGYCGFWISAKPAKAGTDPERLEFHPISYDPTGKAVFGNVIVTKEGKK